MITITVLRNPFNISDREVYQVDFVTEKTIQQYFSPYLFGADPEELVFSRNGRTLSSEELQQCVHDGDFLAVCPVIGKGGGAKKVLSVVASVALMTVSMGVGNLIQSGKWITNSMAGWGFTAQLGAAATLYLGGTLVNHLFPPPKVDVPQYSSANPAYSWDKLQSLTGQGNAIPIIFGTIKTAGQIIAQHVTSDGEKQYLNLLLLIAEGPLDSITDIKINNNPIANYTDVQVDIRLGTNDQDPIPNFSDTFSDQVLNFELATDGSWSTQQTEGNAGEGLEITIEMPNGLYHVNDDGSLSNAAVRVKAEYRVVGTQNWTAWNEWEITAAQNTSFWRAFRVDNIPPAQYEIHCCCSYKSGTTTRDSTTVYWTQLSQIIYDDFARPNRALIGIRALATSQLSSGIPTITCLATRSQVWVWNPNTNQYEAKSGRNPAWASYDIIHCCRQLKNIHTEQNEFVVFGAAAARIEYQAFSDWAAFCDERGFLLFEFSFDVASIMWEALQKPESVGRGKVILKGTRYSCVCDRPRQPVQLFTVGNIVQDQFKEDFLSTKDRANSIEISFVNPDKDYQKDTVTAYSDNWDQSQEIENPTQVTLYGCQSFEQAYKEGKYRLRLNQFLTRTASFDADIDAIACQVGDVILIAHDLPQWGFSGRVLAAGDTWIQLDRQVVIDPSKSWGVMMQIQDNSLVSKTVQSVAVETETDILTFTEPFTTIPQCGALYSFGELNKIVKPFSVISITRSVELKRKITALEYIEAIYTEATDIPVIEYSSLDLLPHDVTNLSVAEETYRQNDGPIISNLLASWVYPSKNCDEFLVFLSSDDGDSWPYILSTKGNICAIPNMITGKTYKVKVITHYGPTFSEGVISDPITVKGKDMPPSDIQGIMVTQSGTDLIVVLQPISDSDLRYYELRIGSNWANGTVLQRFTDRKTQFQAPGNGTLTLWCKAIDNSFNESKNPVKAVVNVVGIPEKNILFEREEVSADWQVQNMWVDRLGRYGIKSQKSMRDYATFADVFREPLELKTDAEIVFPVIDLGENILDSSCYYVGADGSIRLKASQKMSDFERFSDIFGITLTYLQPQFTMQTFVSVDVNYQISGSANVEIEYKTRLDNQNWGEWTPAYIRQFWGRYVQIRLLPKSSGGRIFICGAHDIIDVPDIEETIENLSIPAQKTTIQFQHKFTVPPKSIGLFTQDQTGKAVTWRLSNVTENSMGIELLDDAGNLIAGTLIRATIRGY